MVKKILLLFCAIALSAATMAQTGVLKGKVFDKATNETIPFATVSLLKGGQTIATTQTDINGEYTIKPIPPGEYSVKATYVGYAPSQVNKLRIAADKTTYQDFGVNTSTDLNEVIITEYKVPLIDPDTKTGATVDRQKFNAMATKNISSVASTTAGVYQADEGKGINVRGARSSANGAESSTDVYIDGERVRGGQGVPQQGVEQITVVTGGLPASYGESTGGIISVTTRGPQGQFFGGVEAISSQITDAYGYNFVGWSMGGPIVAKKDTITGIVKPVLGYFFSGEVTTEKDANPSALGWYKIKDDVLTDLEDHPLEAGLNGGTVKRSENITMDDLEKIKARQNIRSSGVRMSGKLDYQPVNNLNFTVGGNLDYNNGHDWVYNYSLYNSQNNPLSTDKTWRVWGRVTQKLNFGNEDGKEEGKKSIISDAYYSLQAGYSKYTQEIQDDDHKKNFFDYGYVGKFKTYKAPRYEYNQTKNIYELKRYQDTLVTFERSEINSLMANNTSDYYKYINDRPLNIDEIRGDGAQINGDRLSSANVHSLWNNAGRQYGGYSFVEQNQFRTFGSFSADFYKKHAIQFGFEFEQRDDRRWAVDDAAYLWTLMRQLTNNQINNLDTAHPIYNAELSGSIGVYDYDKKYEEVAQSNFDKKLREKLGYAVDGTEFIQIDSYDPRTYNLDMFTPDELINKGATQVISYYGYTPHGKRLKKNPSYMDFFNEVDADSNFTRNIGSFRPNYLAFYLQDKFDFRDMKFNVGLRMDRYDANQLVMNDPYSLFKTKKVKDLEISEKPSNIGDDFIPYVSNAGDPSVSTIVGYRDPNSGYPPKWYDVNGVEVSNPRLLTSTGNVFPYLEDPANSVDASGSTNSKNLDFVDYKPKGNKFGKNYSQFNFMPRLAFSFPISDMAGFFAHYDVLTQRPSQGWRNDPLDYYNIQNVGAFVNNPNLMPEKTIDYELGFNQVLSEAKNSVITITAFYRELRNLITTITIAPASPGVSYQTFGNFDFGTVKGLSATYDFRRTGNISFNVNYTLQFADGTGSDAGSNLNFAAANLPNLRTPVPLDYDQRHAFVSNFDFRYDEGSAYNGPVLFGKQVFANAGFNLTARTGSGTPYSGQLNPSNTQTIGVPTRSALNGSINGSRKPWQYRFDLRLDKNFKLALGRKNEEGVRKKFNLNAYLQILNLLNTKNVLEVYNYTGNPDDDGFLASGIGQQAISGQSNQQSYIDLYSLKVNKPSNYSIPRRARIGLSLDF